MTGAIEMRTFEVVGLVAIMTTIVHLTSPPATVGALVVWSAIILEDLWMSRSVRIPTATAVRHWTRIGMIVLGVCVLPTHVLARLHTLTGWT